MRTPLIMVLAAALFAVTSPAWAQGGSPSGTSPVPAPAPDPLQQQLQQQLDAQAALSATKSALAGEVQVATDQEKTLRDLVAANQTAIQKTLAKLAAAETQYNQSSERAARERDAVAAARAQIAKDKALLSEALKARYTQQDGFASYILHSGSFSNLLDRAATISYLTGHSRDLIQQISYEERLAADQAAMAQHDADVAQAAAAQLQTQEQQLQKQTDDARSLIARLGAQAAAASREIQAANSQSLQLAQQIAQTRIQQLDQTIAQAEAAAWQEAEYYIQQNLGDLPAGFSGPAATINADGTELSWPAHGTAITQWFGPSTLTSEPSYMGYAHFHTGVDLAGPLGTPITAAADGVVVAADVSSEGYGNHIIIAHAGGLLTLYGHLEAMNVKVGDAVKRGQLIGLMGSTGNSTGPHCHFELRIGNQPVNPVPYLPALPDGAPGP